MKGKYTITVGNRRLQYKFTIERNISILRGDSATGKTTLIDMIAAYQQNGEASGITINSKKKCSVLTSFHWKENLALIHDSIVFIDEGNLFVVSEEFASAIKNTDNYYVIATRSSLFNLPYSVNEIYGIKNKSGNKYQGTKRLYAEFYSLCDTSLHEINTPDLVIVEDSKAGYQFFSDFFGKFNIKCISAEGNAMIYQELLNRTYSAALVIADGAAFGAEIERVLSLKRIRNFMLYLPESFEWMILRSGLLKDAEIDAVLDSPYNYIQSELYFSWERFFTDLLERKSQDMYLRYKKDSINTSYLNSNEQAAIIDVMPNLNLSIEK